MQAVDDVLEEEHLGGAGLVGEIGLRVLAFLAAERRVHQHHVVQRRRALEQAAVGLRAGQRVAVPDVRLVDAVQDQVGQRDRVDQRCPSRGRRTCARFSVSSCSAEVMLRCPAPAMCS